MREADLSNVVMGPGFVSVNASAVHNSFNTSATVSVDVASCDTWKIYYSPTHITDFGSLAIPANEVATGSGASGECNSYCSSPTCVDNVLTYTVPHFDGTGGEGEPATPVIPEFSTVGLILVVLIAAIGFVVVSKKQKQ